jgi:transposase
VSDTELLPKSKLEPVRRLEVFMGSGRRRAWTGEQKAEILAESYESGEKVSAVARRHGLTPQQLFGWRREARRRARRQARDEQGEAGGAAFAPVIVEEALSRSAAPAAPNGTAAIEIVLGAATIRVAPGTDAATLTTVLRAVKAAR